MTEKFLAFESELKFCGILGLHLHNTHTDTHSFFAPNIIWKARAIFVFTALWQQVSYPVDME